MTSRKEQNLSALIGALALLVVEKTGKSTGSTQEPNISGIANLILERHGELRGLAKSSLHDKLAKGLAEYIEYGLDALESRRLS